MEPLLSTSTAAARYRARLRRVLDYIDAHLHDDLRVERLSCIAAFSKYHFQRQFSASYGVGVYRYIQMCRLKRAGYELAFRDGAVLQIALANGYEGPEAFARAFKKNFGQTPSDFREGPDWDAWHTAHRPLRELRSRTMTAESQPNGVRIVDFPTTRVAALEHRGHPNAMGDSVRTFIAWRRRNALSPDVSATFNVVYRHETDDCHYELCAATERDVPANDVGVIAKVIPGGRCALLRHVGSEDTLPASIDYLYAQWLPESGEELRDFPLYFQRVRMFPDAPEHEAVTDIFLPLKARA